MKNDKQTSDTALRPYGIRHIAFIMDGNGRWAKARNMPRTYGHQEGFKRVREIASICRELGIHCMSLYAFSTENWKRPQEEIDFLFDYLDRFIKKELPTLLREDCRLRVSGDIARLPMHSQIAITDALDKTNHCQSYVLNICLNYGGQQDIIRAATQIGKAILKGDVLPEQIDDELFSNNLYTAGLPPVDLMVRTSGEMRISNFLMYQLAYAEFIFTDTKWPDFKRKQLYACLDEYAGRNRRFGGL